MEQVIRDEICRFVRESPGNSFPGTGDPYFDEPLVGFAAADDPLFTAYRQVIGEFHRTPGELMADAFGQEGTRAETVICWLLPVTSSTRASNRPQQEWPSRAWAETRSYGEQFNAGLRRHLTAFLDSLGHRAVAPQLLPSWEELPDSPAGIASTWSERHAAYAAGLGTFSLNDGLISPKGIAHRLGSVITDLAIPPSPRPYPHHRSNCLFFRNGSCGACVGRCPAGALSRQGHDKAKCRAYVYGDAPRAVGGLYGVPFTGCGLCQTGVPCEETIPPDSRRHASPGAAAS